MSEDSTVSSEDERVAQYYTDRLNRYGIDPRSLDWGSLATQYLRFSILCGVGALQGTSVLDMGCGLGDLYDFLEHRGSSVHYTGVDVTPGMIAAARTRFPNAQFVVGNALKLSYSNALSPSYDYVVASGLFTFGNHAFLEQMVSAMFSKCKVAVAFNTLSMRASAKVQGEFYAEPGEVLEYCLSLTPWAVLRHDYLTHDCTVYLYREQQQS